MRKNIKSKTSYLVRKTPKSYDGGADLVCENSSKEIKVIIQIKHTTNPTKPIDSKFVDDLIRASSCYDCDKKAVQLVLVTNAHDIAPGAKIQVEQQGIRCFCRDMLSDFASSLI